MNIEIKQTDLPNGLIGDAGYIFVDSSIKLITEPELIIGKEYTFSMYIKANLNKTISVHVSSSDEITFNITSEWNKIYVTYIYDGDILFVLLPRGHYYILNCLLEEGNIASDWTPSPKDTVSSIDVQYYLSSSRFELLDGEWVTEAPEWANNKYMWSRTKKTDGLGYISYSPSSTGTCIAGATGEKGTSVQSIIEEYYKSSSKEELIDGEWVTEAPEWTDGFYIWTRSKITYVNPESVYYTTAICDSTWEAVNEIEIGGRNLARKGSVLQYQWYDLGHIIDDDFIKSGSVDIVKDIPGSPFGSILDYGLIYKAGNNYIIGFELLIDDTGINNLYISNGYGFQNGKVYIDSELKGEFDSDILYPNDGLSHLIKLTFTGVDVDYGSATTIGQEHLLLYFNKDEDITYTAHISNYKIEIGNRQTSWSPAPEDFNMIMNNLNTLVLNRTSEISKGLDSITNKVEKEYITKNDLDDFEKNSVISFVEQTASSITQNFTTKVEPLGVDIENLNNNITEYNKYIRTGIDGINIGSSKSLNELHMDENVIEFKRNNVVKTYLDEDGLHTGNLYLDLTETATFGNFAFVPRSDGSLMFLRVKN